MSRPWTIYKQLTNLCPYLFIILFIFEVLSFPTLRNNDDKGRVSSHTMSNTFQLFINDLLN